MQQLRRLTHPVSGCALILCISLTALLTACGGGGRHAGIPSTVGPPSSVTLSPSPTVSLNAGDVIQMTARVLDSSNRQIFTVTPTFNSSNPAIQIANNGLLCGGTWDSLTTPIVCTPAAAGAAGITSNITATAASIVSNVVVASVHLPVTSVAVTPANPACVSQGGTVNYTAKAFNGAIDITPSVASFNWLVNNPNVASVTTPTLTGTPTTVTALAPGLTTIYAQTNTLNPVNSPPVNFTECPVASITITPATATLAINQLQQMTAVLTDTLGVALTTNPFLVWNSNLSAVASVSTTGSVSTVAPGTANITATCVHPSCNVNLGLTVTSNTAVITVTGSSTTTVYAASTTRSTVVPIATPGTAGTAITLPSSLMPNSMLFNTFGTRAYLGTTGGLIVMDATANTVLSTITNAPGKVLAIAPNGASVLVADSVANRVYIVNVSNNTVTTVNIPGATTADFSPDSSKAFVVSGSTLYIAATNAGLQSRAIGATATDVSFLGNGAFAYLAAPGTPRAAGCDNSVAGGPGGTPLLVETLPDGSQMLAAEASNIDSIAVTISGNTCPPSVAETFTAHSIGTAVTPNQLIVTPDGKHAYLTSSRAGQLISYDVVAGTTGTVTLSGVTVTTTTGGATLDSTTVYVGGSDSAVHRIDVASGTDAQRIPLSFVPDLVAVRPH